MEPITAKIQIKNALVPELPAVRIEALVAPKMRMLCIPSFIAAELGLKATATREIVISEDDRRVVPDVGPIDLSLEIAGPTSVRC